jgi:16S rRNA (adenine1518-N6/adenine1519-N6)-dimethyltransferase
MNWATIMLQKEVADRLVASPNTKQYGIPTVLLQSCAVVEKLMVLKPAEFHPRPKVDSVVVRIEFAQGDTDKRFRSDYDRALFTKIVRAAFSQRRKTLLNTLSAAVFFRSRSDGDKKQEKELCRQALTDADISPAMRAEVLDLDQFITLSNSVSKMLASL